ncbi:MAG: SgcJ/EcaC family oxidoreductase [Promicromonosporaceae bacterium]|nr:SgcJ/EcaC family oxidoreductase [Promicromonosporaceae bacterium]
MTENLTAPAVEQRVRTLLDRWAAGIAERRPDDVAALFTADALFQGFDPAPGFGREAVAGYYAKQPVGLTAEYELLSVREAGDAVIVYAHVVFHRPDGDVPVYLTAVVEQADGAWALSHYHVSRISQA